MSKFRNKGHLTTRNIGLLYQVEDQVRATQTILAQVNMLDNFSAVVKEHSFSAPVAATMKAVPGFEDAVENFPESTIYNLVPEHRTSTRYAMGMEALDGGSAFVTNALSVQTKALAQSFRTAVLSLGQIVTGLKSQIQASQLTLEDADITDEEVAELDTVAPSEEAVGATFAGLESYLGGFTKFDADTLRANPEQLMQEVDALGAMVDELGPVLGLQLTAQGLSDAPKGEAYLPTAGTFAQHGLTKASLAFALNRAVGLTDMLAQIAQEGEEISEAVDEAANDIPEDLNSDDVTYGANEHVTLMCCYATMATKAVRETITITANLMTAVDGIADAIDAGEAALANEPEAENVAEQIPTEEPVAAI